MPAAERGRGTTLAARLAFAFGSGAFLLALFAAVALDLALTDVLEREIEAELDDESIEMQTVLVQPNGERKARELVTIEEAHGTDLLFRIRRADGSAVAASSEIGRTLPLDQDEPRPVLAPARGVARASSGETYHVVRSVVGAPGTTYVVEVGASRAPLERFLRAFRLRAAAIVAIALVVTAGGAYLVARRVVRPVEQVTEAVRRVSSQTLGAERIDVGGAPAEVAELAATFNAMLDRLEGAFRRLKELGADLAHELRTPVQNLRGEAEVALLKERSPAEYRETLAGVLEECERLSRLIDDVLLIERTEARADALERTEVDLAQEIEALRAYFEPAASARGVRIEVAPGAPRSLVVRADRLKVQRALGNLLDNAVKYSPAGGRVTVELRAVDADGGDAAAAAEVAIEDRGPGIAKEDLPRVFERFFRAEKSRARDADGPGGHGLGLAIARTIARAHGGDVTVESEPGRGTRAVVRLPRQ